MYISLLIVLLIGIPLLALVGSVCFMFGACARVSKQSDKLPELPYCECDMHPICRGCTRARLSKCERDGLYTGYIAKGAKRK